MKLIIVLCALFALVNSRGVRYLQPIQGRIIGGQNAAIEDVPYQVALLRNDQQSCGGSIISKKFVLTAAHCTQGVSPIELSVVVGTAWWSLGGTRYGVFQIFVHPLFNLGLYMDYDYSLLQVSTPIAIGTTTVQAIRLASFDAPGGMIAVVSGWGNDRTSQLKMTYAPVVSRDECRGVYGQRNITDRMMCAGWVEGGDNTCQGDSGGPLVVNGQQVGIVSWAVGCAQPGYPTVFANVANQREWIRGIAGV